MFKIERPDKKMVGKRIRNIKSDLGLSISEFGLCLGVKKPTINSYIQGYTLLPFHIAEKISEMGCVSVEWLYYGTNCEKTKSIDEKNHVKKIPTSKIYELDYFDGYGNVVFKVEILEDDLEKICLREYDFLKCLKNGELFFVKKENICSLLSIELEE